MLKKILITLKYGESKARTIMILVLFLVLSGLGVLIWGISAMKLIPLIIGTVLLVAGLLLLFSFSYVDIDVNVEKAAAKKADRKKKKAEKKDDRRPEENKKTEIKEPEADIDFSMLEDELSDIAIGIGGVSIPGPDEEVSSSDNSSDEADDTLGIMDPSIEKQALEALSDLSGLVSGAESDKADASSGIGGLSDGSVHGLSTDGVNELLNEDDEHHAKKHEASEFTVKKPTPKQIKARQKMLKVRKDDRRFTPIIVDVWKEVSALRVPAFVADKGKTANIILVEGALRTELMPMEDFLTVTYKRNIEEVFMENYDEIRNEPEVNAIFGELLPSFYPGNGASGSNTFYKNLYILGGKLCITPRSLRKLFNKFDFKFKVFDSLDIGGSYSKYFKSAYENRIFWTDNVISQNDYQERIRLLLQSMVEDTGLLTSDFEKDLELMIRYNLITREYADYYTARKKDKIRIHI